VGSSDLFSAVNRIRKLFEHIVGSIILCKLNPGIVDIADKKLPSGCQAIVLFVPQPFHNMAVGIPASPLDCKAVNSFQVVYKVIRLAFIDTALEFVVTWTVTREKAFAAVARTWDIFVSTGANKIVWPTSSTRDATEDIP